MDKTMKSEMTGDRMAGLLTGGAAIPRLDAFCIVHTNALHSPEEKSLQSPTATEYQTLDQAYTFFNEKLFYGSLPAVLITLQRHRGALGYFSPKRFQHRSERQQHVHEIALNPDYFSGAPDSAVCQTLVHEMAHVCQQEFGRPGRGRYHNREFARIMFEIGLMCSTTGKPGGEITGESMSDYVIESGQFSMACADFLSSYRLSWQSISPAIENSAGAPLEEGGVGSGRDGASGLALVSGRTRTKYTCPNCGLNAWAKPQAAIDCHQCSLEANEIVLMLAGYTRLKR
jgi:predicted RNA-binding Zn-ribbon protein involved in translation (DUF1610 family)